MLGIIALQDQTNIPVFGSLKLWLVFSLMRKMCKRELYILIADGAGNLNVCCHVGNVHEDMCMVYTDISGTYRQAEICRIRYVDCF